MISQEKLINDYVELIIHGMSTKAIHLEYRNPEQYQSLVSGLKDLIKQNLESFAEELKMQGGA